MPHECLSTAYERREVRNARIIGGVVLGLGLVAVGALVSVARLPAAALLLPPVAAALAYRVAGRKLRRRRHILDRPFPPAWSTVLERDVWFYRRLPEEERKRFRRELQVFLGEKRITGVGLELDETTRVLAGASAIIPIFGFPDWEWDQIREVLIYPDRFDRDYSFAGPSDRSTLGMVGTGALERMMILSKPDLLRGFRNPGDGRNVGLHEFAHLVDKSDGAIDGLPGVGLPHEAVKPWLELVRRKMAEMRRGASDIDPYGLTNEAEFFAVTAEYFFERPEMLRRKHPDLYAMLARAFRQDPAERSS